MDDRLAIERLRRCTHPAMALDQDTLRQRLDAGRSLRGITQLEFAAMFAEREYGKGKTDFPRIERGELPMRPSHIQAAVELLRLPAAWFTEPDIDLLILDEPQESALRRVEDQLVDVRHAQKEMRRQLGALGRQLDRIQQQQAEQASELLALLRRRGFGGSDEEGRSTGS